MRSVWVGMLRLLGWALLAAALAGFVHDHHAGSKMLIGGALEAFGLPTSATIRELAFAPSSSTYLPQLAEVARGIAEAIERWPAWPVALLAGVLLITLTRRKVDSRPAAAADARVQAEAVPGPI